MRKLKWQEVSYLASGLHRLVKEYDNSARTLRIQKHHGAAQTHEDAAKTVRELYELLKGMPEVCVAAKGLDL